MAGGTIEPTAVIELVLGLLVLVTLAVTASRRLGIPYPIMLVVGGLLLGFVPGLPQPQLAPELAFLIFLPPLLFAAGYFTSLRDFRADLRAISLLAVGLVLVTIVAVAVVLHLLLPDLPLAAAFVMGAIVAPPDAVAATAIARRIGLPRRIVTILEGESLINDATALVAYRVAVAAVLSGSFSLVDAGLSFVGVAAGGVVAGLVVGYATVLLLRHLTDPPVEVTITLLAPFAAYISAESLAVSGVLATVTAGILVGHRAPRVMSSETRLIGSGAWQMLLFVLNGLVFILIGLQLPSILAELDRSPVELLGLALAVSLTVIVVRLVWVFPGAYLPRLLSRSLRERDPYPRWQRVFVLGWAGMRGIVSLAAALALPLDFPERGLFLFVTLSVIVATLVGQGLTLPLVMRALGVTGDTYHEEEEAHARTMASLAASARIGRLYGEWPAHRELIEHLQAQYAHRDRHLAENQGDGMSVEAETELIEHGRIRRAVIDAERDAIIGLRDRGAISAEALRRVERDLDLEELRLEA